MTLVVLDKSVHQGVVLLANDDLVIDFYGQLWPVPGLLDLSDRYNCLRMDVREEYIDYISALGNKKVKDQTIKQLFTVDGASLWWFNTISLKDCFNDPLFDDVCKTLLIHELIAEGRVDNVRLYTESPWLEVLIRRQQRPMFAGITRSALRRIKLAAVYLVRHLIVRVSSSPGLGFQPRTLFFDIFPGNWNRGPNGNDSDRFYRDLPNDAKDAAYLFLLENGNRMPGGGALTVQRYVSVAEILTGVLDISNACCYWRLRRAIKQFFVFKGLDLSFVFDFYMWDTILFRELYSRLVMRGVTRALFRLKPVQIVTVDEFGYLGRAVCVAARRAGVKVVWLQHATISRWKLWYFHRAGDFAPDAYKRTHDFIRYQPICDSYILWSAATQDMICETGFPRGCTTVCGNPRYDAFVAARNSASDESAGAVVFAPSIHIDEAMLFADLALIVRKRTRDKVVILKLHPRYKELLLDAGFSARIDGLKSEGIQLEYGNIEKYYTPRTILVGRVTTVGIEASYFGAKVVSYIPKYQNIFVPEWIDSGTYATSVDELIDKVRSPEHIPPLDWTRYFVQPGTAARCVLNLLNAG